MGEAMSVNSPTKDDTDHAVESPVNDTVRVLYASVLFLPIVGLLCAYIAQDYAYLWDSRWELVLWTTAFAGLSLLHIPAGSRLALAPGEPLALAICVLFPAPTASLIVFLGACEPRELASWRDTVRGLTNRSHTALGILLASATAHAVMRGTAPGALVGATFAAWVVWSIENHIAVALGLALYLKTPFTSALRRLRLGKPVDYAITVAVWLLLAASVVLLYPVVGPWSIFIVALPALLARQVLVRSDSLVRAEAELSRERLVVSALTERIAAERRDERHRVAGDLHDEIVQPLFQVSLLARVAARDLTTGQLAELQNDLSHLCSSADLTLAALRDVLKGLRSSPLGSRGLSSALGSLADSLSSHGGATLTCEFDDASGLDDGSQLVIYQVAREALTNASHHSRATSITASLRWQGEAILLTVQDDGKGFDTGAMGLDHFGLLIMEERARSIGGSVFVDSILGRGTTVTGYFPGAR